MDHQPMSDNQKRNEGGLDPAIQSKLGKKLKEAYADVINEPVPDRFLELLSKLENSDQKKSGSGT